MISDNVRARAACAKYAAAVNDNHDDDDESDGEYIDLEYTQMSPDSDDSSDSR